MYIDVGPNCLRFSSMSYLGDWRHLLLHLKQRQWALRLSVSLAIISQMKCFLHQMISQSSLWCHVWLSYMVYEMRWDPLGPLEQTSARPREWTPNLSSGSWVRSVWWTWIENDLYFFRSRRRNYFRLPSGRLGVWGRLIYKKCDAARCVIDVCQYGGTDDSYWALLEVSWYEGCWEEYMYILYSVELVGSRINAGL